MNPETLANSGTESGEQRALFAWCALNIETYPELKWFHAIPNGGSRGDTVQSRMIRGSTLKAEGLKAGVSDCFLPVKRGIYSGLYIEMKNSKGKPTKEQIEFGEFVKSQHFGFKVCYSWIEARDLIVNYLKWI